ncbi:hypothetical protein LguiB_017430 [Lonicera macranthoides]
MASGFRSPHLDSYCRRWGTLGRPANCSLNYLISFPYGQSVLLPLGRSLRLREVGWSREPLGLWIKDLEIFMEEE